MGVFSVSPGNPHQRKIKAGQNLSIYVSPYTHSGVSVCRVAHGLDWSWMVGVVSNYLHEKLHQPPITDIQPYQHHYTPSEVASQWIYILQRRECKYI